MALYILGISAFFHDSAAVLLRDHEIIAAAQEERFTRKKHDPDFPHNAIEYCLEEAAISIEEVDYVVFYDKPFLKFERLLETYYAYAPKGLLTFIKAMPVWAREKLFLKDKLWKHLKGVGPIDRKKTKLLFTEHHLSHAASAYYGSGYTESAIVTIDGVGEWATASLCYGKEGKIEILEELHFPHSLGLLYSAFTYFLGFKVNVGEYKLMGLAPYGNREDQQVLDFCNIIKTKLIDIKTDGSIWLDQEYFSYCVGDRMPNVSKWEALFGMKRREGEADLEKKHFQLAQAIQMVTEEVVLKMCLHAKELTGSDNLCLAGGVALNCVANGKIAAAGEFSKIFAQPASGDAGGALGAAWSAWYLHLGNAQVVDEPDNMKDALLGPSYSDKEVLQALKRGKCEYNRIPEEALYDTVAELIHEGNVIGWFQGRMEWGPRALGNRSILADPTNTEMQEKLNLKIKYRESFRPFAPIVLAEDASELFKDVSDSPYMMMVDKFKKEHLFDLQEDYYDLPIREMLYKERSKLQAVTHVDGSARIQTVTAQSNERLYSLLKAFKQRSSYGVLINTSFNVRGEPIVCSPTDAIRCFMTTEMDYLVLGNYLLNKKDQPETNEKVEWTSAFSLD